MQIDEVISKAEQFVMEFVAKLTDKSEQSSKRQVYFLDNQDKLQQYMGALQKIVAGFKDDENITVDDSVLLDRANDIIDKLKATISEFQKELTVSDDITEEDTTVQFTEETLKDAMKTNKTTQEIAANMNAIAESQKAKAKINYNYALVCDDQITMLTANNAQELNDAINAIADSGSYKSIDLYKMQFTPVPLKKKTILSV